MRSHSIVLLLATLSSVLLAGCEKDDVPAVADPHAIVVDGRTMTQSEFISKYCRDKVSNKTCAAVRDAKLHDDSHRPIAGGW